MSLTNAEKQAVDVFHQILRLGPKPYYVRQLEMLLKDEPQQPADRPKQMLYAAHMYSDSYKFEDGEETNRGAFHGYLGVLQNLNLLPYMSPLGLNWREGKDFSKERTNTNELADIGHSAVDSDKYRNFNAYQDSIADDLKDINHVVQFQCPSGWIINFRDRSYIIKRQIKNCNMLFKDAKKLREKAERQEISSNLASWTDVKLEVARYVEINEDGKLKVKDSPTYVIPTFGTEATASLERYGREFSHAAKTQFLLYAHKDAKNVLKKKIEQEEEKWKESVEREFSHDDEMKKDLKRLYAFYKEKSGDTSIVTTRENGHARRTTDRDMIVDDGEDEIL
jgi:hypothetical protein